jgi:hypothetical protein
VCSACGRQARSSHLSRTFKLSKDTQFEAKSWDVIGLYLDPPEKALVLCCDEKSQCEVLERQPGLPLRLGHIRTGRTKALYFSQSSFGILVSSRLAATNYTDDLLGESSRSG